MKYHKWTKKEISILKKTPEKTSRELTKVIRNHSFFSIKSKRTSLRLPLLRGKFSKEKVKELLANNEFLQIITGHMIGDGTIPNKYAFCLRGINLEYIQQLSNYFNSLTGRSNSIYKIPGGQTTICGISTKCKDQYSVTFNCTPIIEKLRKNWYPNGKKIVVKDIELTPFVCNRWYIDDGNLSSDQNRSYCGITIYTDSFRRDEVIFLSNKLNATVKINSYVTKRANRKSDYVIRIYAADTLRFLEYIGPPPTDSFSYKWDTKGYITKNFFCHYCRKTIQLSGFKHEIRKTCGNKMCQHKRALKYQEEYRKRKRLDNKVSP